MTYDLAEALAALHSYGIAHRDIKTDNLLFDDHFCLFLIDFEQTITVASEEEMVADPCGTRYWSAPGSIIFTEVTEGLYSPIRADRYSCGLVFDAISEFAWLDPATVTELKQFSRQLRATDPKTRPPLSKWRRSTNHRVLFSPPE
ncbi:kinase-like protein [Gymnopus androsaceus JB14]|uniref:non-specific serine/threonine protein kinase n=1 Tax=Gymnopus androsaceus JB14 TaxID=1447944 RepID=A0A6A4IP98_9AGAR|nr:kinase-like protein [Gymnopus androsaceus JB14]